MRVAVAARWLWESVAWLRLSQSTELSSHREAGLYCKLIPEPVCGLSCAKASLPHANLSLISLDYSRQVCTLPITSKPQTHSHTLKPLRVREKEKTTECFLFYKQRFQVLTGRWHSVMNILWLILTKGVQFQMMNISFKMHIFSVCFHQGTYFNFKLWKKEKLQFGPR